ncbi:polysaccharide biosynthesis C-terminal domain-containing protein [Vallitaleaceae bacterium 9-2]
MKVITQMRKNPYIHTIGTKVILVLLGLANSILINRYLGATLKGHYSYVMNIVIMTAIFMNLGVYQGYSSFKKEKIPHVREKFIQFFKWQMVFNYIVTLGVFFTFSIDYKYFLLLIPLHVTARQMDFLCLIENIHIRNVSKIITTIVHTVALFIIYFFLPEANLLFIFFMLLLQQLVDIGVKLNMLEIHVFNLGIKFDVALFKKAVQVGILPLLSLLLITSNYNIDIFILKELAKFEDVGIYSLAVNLGGQLWLIPDAFKDVLFGKNAKKNDIKSIVEAIKFNFVFSLFMVLFFVIFGRMLIGFLYDDEFIRAYVPLVIIISGNVFMIFYKFIYTLFIADGKRKLSVVIFSVSVLINVGLNFLLIPRMNINGAALASLASYSFCGVAFLAVFMKKYKVELSSLILKKTDIQFYYNAFKRAVKR